MVYREAVHGWATTACDCGPSTRETNPKRIKSVDPNYAGTLANKAIELIRVADCDGLRGKTR